MDEDKKRELDFLVELWRETIGVQKHFNDLSLKVRSYLVTVLGGLIVAVAYLYKENVLIEINGFSFNAGFMLIAAGIVLLLAIRIMDRNWYHELLRGAVKTGMEIEKLIKSKYGNQDLVFLTTQIKEDSEDVRIRPLFVLSKLRWAKFNSTIRMRLFYGFLGFTYLFLAISFAFLSPKKAQAGASEDKKVQLVEMPVKLKYYNTVLDTVTNRKVDLWVVE
ncbi:MAG: hypothetical protein JXQ90_05415 [Cyclobacteriaceae bacterium]